jgi:uncharacterized phage-associated protein
MIEKKKYYNVVLYFADKIRNDSLGKVKLMKLLYYLDFDFFEKYGKSVTGDQYVRMPLGPVPEKGDEVIAEMREAGMIRICHQKMPDLLNDKQLIVPLEKPDISSFSPEEVQMLDEISTKWERFSGREMKDASHGEAPWIATKPNCAIDYNLAYYRNKYNRMSEM